MAFEIKEFVIPENIGELIYARLDRYVVTEFVNYDEVAESSKRCNDSLATKGAGFILSRFNLLYGVLECFDQLEADTVQEYCSIILNAMYQVTLELSKVKLHERMNPFIQHKYRNILKMISYIACTLAENMERQYGKQAVKLLAVGIKKTWHHNKQVLMTWILYLVKLPIHFLWKNHVAETSFVELLSSVCYKMMENEFSLEEKSMEGFRTNIQKVLFLLVKRHQHVVKFSQEAVRMLCIHRHLKSTLLDLIVVLEKRTRRDVGLHMIGKSLEITPQYCNTKEDMSSSREFLVTMSRLYPHLVQEQYKLLSSHDNKIGHIPSGNYSSSNTMRAWMVEVAEHLIVRMMEDGRNTLTFGDVHLRNQLAETVMNAFSDIQPVVLCKASEALKNLICGGKFPGDVTGESLRLALSQVNCCVDEVRENILDLLLFFLTDSPIAKVDFSQVDDILKRREDRLSAIDHLKSKREEWCLVESRMISKFFGDKFCDHMYTGPDKWTEQVSPKFSSTERWCRESLKMANLLVEDRVPEAVICSKILLMTCCGARFTGGGDKKSKCGSLWAFLKQLKELYLQELSRRKVLLLLEDEDDQLGEGLIRSLKESYWNTMREEDVDVKDEVRMENNLKTLLRCLQDLKNVDTALSQAVPKVALLLDSENLAETKKSMMFMVLSAFRGVQDSMKHICGLVARLMAPSDKNTERRELLCEVFISSCRDMPVHNRSLLVIRTFTGIVGTCSEAQMRPMRVFFCWLIHLDTEDILQFRTMWNDLPEAVLSSGEKPEAAISMFGLVAKAMPATISPIDGMGYLIHVGLSRLNDPPLLRSTLCILLKLSYDPERRQPRLSNNHLIPKRVLYILKHCVPAFSVQEFISVASKGVDFLFRVSKDPLEMLDTIMREVWKHDGNIKDDRRYQVGASRRVYLAGRTALRLLQYEKERIVTSRPKSSGNDVTSTILKMKSFTTEVFRIQFSTYVEYMCLCFATFAISRKLWSCIRRVLHEYMDTSYTFCAVNLKVFCLVAQMCPFAQERYATVKALAQLSTKYSRVISDVAKALEERVVDASPEVRLEAVQYLCRYIRRGKLGLCKYAKAICIGISDQTPEVASEAKRFFREDVAKTNPRLLVQTVMEVLRPICRPQSGLSQQDSLDTFRFLMCLLGQKNKTLVADAVRCLCQMMEDSSCSITERRCIAMCLSVVPHTEVTLKHIRAKFVTCLSKYMRDKLVAKYLLSIVDRYKDFDKIPETVKILVIEISNRMRNCMLTQRTENAIRRQARKTTRKKAKITARPTVTDAVIIVRPPGEGCIGNEPLGACRKIDQRGFRSEQKNSEEVKPKLSKVSWTGDVVVVVEPNLEYSQADKKTPKKTNNKVGLLKT